jgi:hypothetical protein
MRFIALLLAALSPALAQSDVAHEAYIFGYPLVIMDLTKEVFVTHNQPNELDHLREFPDYTFRTVVRPNADTLYSSAWLDLAAEPVVLTVPDTRGRYYLVQLMDAWTNTFAVPGTRTTGNHAANFAIVGPHWNGRLPANIKPLHSPTDMVWLLGRIQTNTSSDYPFVHSLQDQFHLTPLSAWPRFPEPDAPRAKRDRAGRTPLAEMDKMETADFFTRLCRLMANNPPAPADAPLMKRLATIGVVPGKPFSFAGLPAETRQALESGVAEARKELSQKIPEGRKANGWGLRYDLGKYGVDYYLRAQVARRGLGANLPEDALYPQAQADANGHPFDGSHRYVIHFDKSQLPPVNAFWSLTVYDTRGFFTENPNGRYAIGDRDHLRYNPDGSLDLYIQHTRPGPDKESNWLPSPAEAFNMSLRLYWPKPSILDGSWTPPPIRRVE